MTYEGWIRPTDGTLSGDLLTWEKKPNDKDMRIYFDGNNIAVDMNGITQTIPITYTDVDTWHYVGVSIYKYDDNNSKICAVFGTGTESCTTINTVVSTDPSGNTFQVGDKFRGMIKDFSLLDWPKTGYEFTSSIQTAGCTPWNGVTCTHCPATTGQCISSCPRGTYGPSCTPCLDPYCANCYSDTYDQCYQCQPGYDFTYHGQSCPGECGNGVVENALEEYCDDGNLNDGDGCNSLCAIEAGYTCSEKTPTSPSVCKKACDYSFGYYYGYYECQDGNDEALDGCDGCVIERGWKCVDGSPWNPDVCSELCGDGINYGEHE